MSEGAGSMTEAEVVDIFRVPAYGDCACLIERSG